MAAPGNLMQSRHTSYYPASPLKNTNVFATANDICKTNFKRVIFLKFNHYKGRIVWKKDLSLWRWVF